MTAGRVIALGAALLGAAAAAVAQTRVEPAPDLTARAAQTAAVQPTGGVQAARSVSPRMPRVEVYAGASWLGSYGLGEGRATLTGNQAPTGSESVLFTTSSEMASAPAFDGRLGVLLTGTLSAEAGFAFSRPEWRTRIAEDVEAGESVTASDGISQYVIEGALVARVPSWAFAGGRAVPFVSGGAGYLRQLGGDDRVVDTGVLYHAGAGVSWGLAEWRRGAFRALGIRTFVRGNVRTGGMELDDAARAWLSAGGGVVLSF